MEGQWRKGSVGGMAVAEGQCIVERRCNVEWRKGSGDDDSIDGREWSDRTGSEVVTAFEINSALSGI